MGSYMQLCFQAKQTLAVDSTNLVSDLVQYQRHIVVEDCLHIAQDVACVCRELLVQMENSLLIPAVGCTVQERLDYATRSARFGYANVRVCQRGLPLRLQARSSSLGLLRAERAVPLQTAHHLLA